MVRSAEVTEDILHGYIAIIVSVQGQESLANCLVITLKLLFNEALQNCDPVFYHERLVFSVLNKLFDGLLSVPVCLTLGIVLHQVQLREKCFFEQIEVHSLRWHAGSFTFDAHRVRVEKVVHCEAHVNVLDCNVFWQAEKHF